MSTNLLPGNIKQMLVPFVLDPNKKNTVNRARNNSDLKKSLPQVFTYKSENSVIGDFAKAQLSFMPKAFANIVREDISYKLLYNDSNITSLTPNAIDITVDTIFNNIPGVQIREFLPDTKLDLLLTAIGSLLELIGKVFKDKTLTNIGAEFVKSLESVTSQVASMDINAFKKFGSYLVNYLLNVNSDEKLVGQGTASTFVNDLFTNGMTLKFDNIYTGNRGDCLLDAMALKIPYMLYYGLQSTTTTNIYEVPFVNEPKLLYTSTGSAGWGDSAGFISHILDSAKSILGSIIPNIGISMTPWWNTSSGQGTFEDEVVVNFDLYNDGKEQAMKNFIFVNTIIPNNKWLQYGLIQHSPCLYDVKVEGIKRMYACTGDFKVTYSGVLRKMPKKFIKDLASKHINLSFADGQLDDTPSKPKKERKYRPSPYDSEYYDGLNVDYEKYSADAKKIDKENEQIDAENEQIDAENLQRDAENLKRTNDKDQKVALLLDTFEQTIRIPDVYHVSLTFKSLLPSNLNLYLFLYIGNTNITTQVANEGARPVNVVGNITKGIGNVANSLGKILDEASATSIDKAASSAAAEDAAEFDAARSKAKAEQSRLYAQSKK